MYDITPAKACAAALGVAAIIGAPASVAGQCRVNEQLKLTPADPIPVGQFGVAVAVDGDWAVVGSNYGAAGGINSGVAYVFQREDDSWAERARLEPLDPHAYDSFGASVAISGDVIVVGAYGTDGACPQDTQCNSGSAYVFRRVGDAWTQEAKVTAYDAEAGDNFGCDVATDGDRIVVGALYDGDGSSENSGSAYVFAFDGGSWSFETKLIAPDVSDESGFGQSVAIDGDTILIGAPRNDFLCPWTPGCNAGAAYVFTFDAGWDGGVKLTASDADRSDHFGWSVALDGDVAIIGAPFDDHSGFASGAAYVFRDAGSWTEEARITAAVGEMADRFGWDVAIADATAVVGAPVAGDDAGAVYTFVSDGGGWTEAAIMGATDADADDWFGGSVAVSGGDAFVGAYATDDSGSFSGSAYRFRNVTDADGNGNLDVCNCSGDINGDLVSDIRDLAVLIENFGRTAVTPAEGDINRDSVVDTLDLNVFIGDFGCRGM